MRNPFSNGSGFSINIDGGNDYLKHAYTTNDRIDGEVYFHFDEDIRIESLIISLNGQCISLTKNLQSWSHDAPTTRTTHNFLTMQHPIDQQKLPPAALAKAGIGYYYPFSFTVPELLLPHGCKHGLDESSVIHQAHRLLPPSLGSPGSNLRMEDLSSEGASVKYTISTRLQAQTCQHDRPRTLSKAVQVRITPTRDESPPLALNPTDPDYRMCSVTDVQEGPRWSVLSTGRLSLEARQPQALCVSNGLSNNTMPVSTTLLADVRFHPRNPMAKPPKLDSVKITLRAFTYSSPTPFDVTPTPSQCAGPENPWHCYSSSIEIPSQDMAALVWTKKSHESLPADQVDLDHDSETLPNHVVYSHTLTSEAAQSPPSPIDGSPLAANGRQSSASGANSSTDVIYRTSLRIPIVLPTTIAVHKTKILVPTFNSCFVCRNYALEVKVSFKLCSERSPQDLLTDSGTANSVKPTSSSKDRRPSVAAMSKSRSSLSANSLTVTVPLQITAQGNPRQPESRSLLNATATYPIRDEVPSWPFDTDILDHDAARAPRYENFTEELLPPYAMVSHQR